MKFAIDRFRIGSEEEVDADIFYNKYIPRRQDRFYCPECGEIVYWRSRGGAHPNQFYHKIKTERSPECDKRVDGRAGLYLYERVGLPVFLTRNSSEQYQLNLGFPAVGEELLQRAMASQAKVSIMGGIHQRTIYVDQANFYDSLTTLVPIDFIPAYSKNYKIRIDSNSYLADLRIKWSDYADGFDDGGAIFTYEETGGKKVRRGDGISPGRQYYVIAKQFSPSHPEISSCAIGEIVLNNEKYIVYLMTIDVTSDDEKRFSKISNYFQLRFGVWLLETFPELIPLWPPVVEQDTMIPVLKGKKIYCGISSGNACPNVYGYYKSDTFLLPVRHSEQGCNMIEVSVSMKEAVISVDRKYAGREIVFMRKDIEFPSFSYEILLENEKGTPLPLDAVTPEVLSSELFIKTNAKMELYIGSKDKTFQHIAISEESSIVPARQNSAILYFIIENGVFLCCHAISKIKQLYFDEMIYVKKIEQSYHGELVPVPRWTTYLLRNCQKAGKFILAESIARAIRGSKIYYGVLKVLVNLKTDIEKMKAE